MRAKLPPMTQTQERESFVLWIEREAAGRGELRGWVECLRRSERTAFDSGAALLRFLERNAPGPDRPRTVPAPDPGES